jgi:hypothetical protein
MARTSVRGRGRWPLGVLPTLGMVAIAAVSSASRARGSKPCGRRQRVRPRPKPGLTRPFARARNSIKRRTTSRRRAGTARPPIGDMFVDRSGPAISTPKGKAFPQDRGEALLWYRMAADQGNDEAQNSIGFFYVSAWGVLQDYAEGMRWLRKAADQGNEVAQRNIGMLYLQGLERAARPRRGDPLVAQSQ